MIEHGRGLLFSLIWTGVAVLLPAGPARAWHGEGHELAARAALTALPKDSMPAFFPAGGAAVTHASREPDAFLRPIAPADLSNAEMPEHHFDIEFLDSNAPPSRRYDFLALCYAKKIDPRKAGTLPYAVTEWTHRLAVALAEHRRWPHNPYIQQKCLLYAGILSHYAADLCQPLHTTIHYDGRAGKDGNSPRSGIHLKMDALLGKLSVDANRPPAGVTAAPFGDLMAAVLAEIAASHALVDRVYELEKALPPYDAPLEADSPAAALAAERLRACARFTASLYLTAWKESQQIRLPEWHKREPAATAPSP